MALRTHGGERLSAVKMKRNPKTSQPRRAGGSGSGTPLNGEFWLWAAVLMALAVLAYWPTLSNGFIWDDDAYVENNPTLRTAQGLFDMWFKLGAIPQYYPLVHTTFWIEYHLWELNPLGYHIVNMLLHGLSGVLAWRLLARLEVPGAWLAAALFVVHPVEVESVAWVTERKNVLSMTLALGSLLAYFRFCPPEPPAEGTQQTAPEKAAWGWYALALALYVGALWSKTVTASVPAVVLVIFWWKRGTIRVRDVVPLLPFFVVGLSLASVTAWMERTMVGAEGADWAFSRLDRILIAGRALWFYAAKLAWPYPLCFFYVRWQIDDHAWWQYLYPAAAAAVMVGLWLARGRIGRGPLAAVLIFAGVLVPALGFFNVFPFLYSFVADHFQYHASLALLALAAATLVTLARRWGGETSWPMRGVAAVLLLVLCGLTQVRTWAYKDLMTLYNDTITRNPTCWAAYTNLGVCLNYEGKYAEAVEVFRKAAEIAPQRGIIRTGLGKSLIALAQYDEAQRQLQMALDSELLKYQRVSALVYMGTLKINVGQYDEALAYLKEALDLDPKSGDAIYNTGVAIAAKGDLPGGIEKVKQSLAINPDFDVAQHELGAMCAALGRYDLSLVPFERAVTLKPDNPKYREDLGTALLHTGNNLGAKQQLQRSVQLQPGNPEAHNALGVACQNVGDLATAAAHFRAALRIQPTHEAARANLQRLEQSGGGGTPPSGRP